MKKMIPLLTLVIAACSTTANKEMATQDSTTFTDTVNMASLPDQEPTVQSEVQADTSMLVARFDEVSSANTSAADNYYTVSITTSQYEASSDVTWYFDNSFSPRYFKMSWAAEGNEGSTEYFIENDKVVCAAVEESNQTTTWCHTTGGTRTTWNESADTGSTELLGSDFGADCNERLEQFRNILTAILTEGEITEKNEEAYTIRIEKTLDVGTEVTESTEVKIPKKVYAFIKEQ